jgi:uncharacterized membrane protein
MYDRAGPRNDEYGINAVPVALSLSFVAPALVCSRLPVLDPFAHRSAASARHETACARILSVYLRYPSVDFRRPRSTMK